MDSIIIISTTLENEKDAEKIAKKLLEKKLIACAQVSGPLLSYYRWEGKVTHSAEYKLSVKTLPSARQSVEDVIDKHHPYELPEVIVNNVDYTTTEYLNWVKEEVEV